MDSRWIGPDNPRRLFSASLPEIAALPPRLLAELLLGPLPGLLSGLLLALLLSLPARAASPAALEFHIRSGDVTLTLNEFSRQANLQLLFDFGIVRGRTTRAVDGYFEPRDALRRMLLSTGLELYFVNERTLAVTPVQATGSATPPPANRPRAQSNTQSVSRGQRNANPALLGPADIDTVRVTGTNLRGESPVGAHVIKLDRQTIDDSGAGTVGDFLRTLPQVFGGGPTQDTRQIGTEAQSNSGFGTGVNLRGLGARATLVLINGRRIAPGGTEGAFVDIDNIPLSAVERIDVLPDGVSALYGADAVGGVVNFVMRENFTGSETMLSAGQGTQDTLHNYLVSQTLGHKWDDASGVVSVEFYRRDALPASDRRYAVSNLTPFGGGDFDSFLTSPGNLLVGGVPYAIPDGQDGTHLSANSLIPGTLNQQNKYLGAEILPQQQRLSLYATGRRNFGDRLSFFSDVLLTDRKASERTGGATSAMFVPSTNPFYVNPTGGTDPVLVYYNFLNDLGPGATDVSVKSANATFGVDFDAGASWKVSAYGGFAREQEDQTQSSVIDINALEAALADPDPATAFNPFGVGYRDNPQTLRTLTFPYRYRLNSQLKMADLTADGPLWHMPGGAAKLAVGVDRRDQFFDSDTPASFFSPEHAGNLSRETSAAFSELVVPLFGPDNARPGLNKLEISGAARYEDYSGFGHATSPRFGLLWSPAPGLALRSTWSRSLRAPSLADLDESLNLVIPQALADNRSPSGQALALIWTGQNAGLREEHANSWTAGLDFAPEPIRGFTLGLTLFDIAFRDRIEDTAFAPDLLTNPRYSGLVTFNPAPVLVDYVCNHSIFYLGSKSDCLALGATAIVDLRVHNVETLRTRGIDFTAKYEVAGSYGKLNFGLDGTYLLKYEVAEGNGSPEADLLNTQNNPLSLRFRGTVGWTGRRLGLNASVNYSNSYRDTASEPSVPVSSWTTIDLQARYRMGMGEGGWLDHTQVELNAVNVFNRDPPFLNNQIVGIGYDQENADPYGRLVSLLVRKSW